MEQEREEYRFGALGPPNRRHDRWARGSQRRSRFEDHQRLPGSPNVSSSFIPSNLTLQRASVSNPSIVPAFPGCLPLGICYRPCHGPRTQVWPLVSHFLEIHSRPSAWHNLNLTFLTETVLTNRIRSLLPFRVASGPYFSTFPAPPLSWNRSVRSLVRFNCGQQARLERSLVGVDMGAKGRGTMSTRSTCNSSMTSALLMYFAVSFLKEMLDKSAHSASHPQHASYWTCCGHLRVYQ